MELIAGVDSQSKVSSDNGIGGNVVRALHPIKCNDLIPVGKNGKLVSAVQFCKFKYLNPEGKEGKLDKEEQSRKDAVVNAFGKETELRNGQLKHAMSKTPDGRFGYAVIKLLPAILIYVKLTSDET